MLPARTRSPVLPITSLNWLAAALLASALLTGCGPSSDATPATTKPVAGIEAPPAAVDEAATTALRKLADDVWNSSVEHSTYLRLQEGLPINEFEDLTLEQYHRQLAQTDGFREQLASIDPDQLSGDDLITYEILDLQLEDNGANDDDFWLNFDITAYLAPYYFQFAKQALAAQQITDEAAANHYLMLVGELADMLDHLQLKVAGQVERGIYLPGPPCPPSALPGRVWAA